MNQTLPAGSGQGGDSAAKTKGDKKGKLDDFLQLMQPAHWAKCGITTIQHQWILMRLRQRETGKISDNEGSDSDGESSDDDDYQKYRQQWGSFQGRSPGDNSASDSDGDSDGDRTVTVKTMEKTIWRFSAKG